MLSPNSRAAAAAGAATHGPLTFTAVYLPMGNIPAVVEQGVALDRLRTAPLGSSPFEVFPADVSSLQQGDLVQCQWKGRRTHPWGWWLATIQAIAGAWPSAVVVGVRVGAFWEGKAVQGLSGCSVLTTH